MSRRTRAFKRPPPADWRPAIGETVYLPYVLPDMPRHLGRIQQLGEVLTVWNPDLVLIRTRYRSKEQRQTYAISDLRPYPPKRAYRRTFPLTREKGTEPCSSRAVKQKAASS